MSLVAEIEKWLDDRRYYSGGPGAEADLRTALSFLDRAVIELKSGLSPYYKEGCVAFMQKLPRTNNPHPTYRVREHHEWDKGWADAQEKAITMYKDWWNTSTEEG